MRLVFRSMLAMLAVVTAAWLSLLLNFSDSRVQTWTARAFAQWLSKTTGTTITIGRLDVDFTLRLSLNDVKVFDLYNQPMFEVSELRATPASLHFARELKLKNLYLEQPFAHLIRYQGDTLFNYQVFINAIEGGAASDSGSVTQYPVSVSKLRINGGNFAYIIQDSDTVAPRQMDYNRIRVMDIRLDARNLQMSGNELTVQIEQLSAREYCGLSLERLQTTLSIRSGEVNAKNLAIKAGDSELQLDMAMYFTDLSDFEAFIDSVFIDAEIRPSRLYMADLGYFSEELFAMPNMLSLSGKAKGTVANFVARDFSLAYGANTLLEADVKMQGLPDIYNTIVNLNIRSLSTVAEDVSAFRLPTESGRVTLPELMKNWGNIRLKGFFNGKYNDFISRIDLRSSLGQVDANVVVRTNPLDNRTFYQSNLIANKLQAGKLLSAGNMLGQSNLMLKLEGEGLTYETAKIKINGKISQLQLYRKQLEDIAIKTSYDDFSMQSEVSISDPDFQMHLSGLIDFSFDKPLYTIEMAIDTANLVAMGVVKNDSLFGISTLLTGQFSLTGEEDFIGSLSLQNTAITNGRGHLRIKNTQLSVVEDPFLERKLTLQSDPLQLELGGKFLPSRIGASLLAYFYPYFKHNWFTTDDAQNIQDFYYNLRIKDLTGISRLFIPDLTISPNASFTGVYVSASNLWQSTFFADSVNISGIDLHKTHAQINGAFNKFLFSVRTQQLVLYRSADPSAPNVSFENNLLQLEAASDSVKIGFSWANANSTSNRGALTALLEASDPATARFSVLTSDIRINDSILSFNPLGKIVINEKNTFIDNFSINLGNSSLLLNGNLPQSETDTLSLAFKHWEISNFNFLLAPYGVSTGGLINGELSITNVDNNPAFTSNLTVQNLLLNKEKLGDARLMSSWAGGGKSLYINAQLVHRGNVGSGRTLHLRGFFNPALSEGNLDLSLQLENFRLRVLNTFLEGYVSQLEGFASGSLAVGGSLAKPVVKGNLGLYRTSFIIDYLNVRYSLQHDFEIQPNRIVLRDLILIDTANNRASVNGVITHKYLRDFSADLRLQPNNFIALNTRPVDNSLFYGTAVVSGELLIRGPFDNIEMSIRVITQRGTQMVIPIDMSSSIGTSDYITFTKQFNAEDESGSGTRLRPVISTSFGINLETIITPDAGLRIYMPYNTGTLDARGSGTLSMGVNTAGEFTLNGEYTLQSGQFNFTYENLIKRRFDLIEGGRIAWAGDPFDATIDAKGVYKVKASLAGLGLDTTRSLGNRVNVDCIIQLSNNLFNPDIRFSFRFPNIDSQLEQSIFSVIDTTNTALVTQQMISLLVLGSFASSGSIDNFSFSNSSLDVLSGQLSSWLSQISKDFDIGLYYRPGDQLSPDEVEVALSTQLFNERVTIDGNFGMVNSRSATQNASNIVGDVDINVKLTRDGRLRLRAFNHSNVNNWLSTSAFDRYTPYTQGLGLSFRQEFDRFDEIFRRKRKPKTNQK